MTFTLLIITALVGAALLGFICAWYSRQQAIDVAKREKGEVVGKMAGAQAAISHLESEAKTHQLTLETLQKQNQTAENEVIKLQTELRVVEGELQVLQRDYRNLRIENNLLIDDLKNDINEISVIREIPEFEPKNGQQNEAEQLELEQRIENAKRLVNAFKKGVSENSNTVAE